MIAKCASIKGPNTRKLLSYCINKPNAKIIDQNKLGSENPIEISNEFLRWQKLNTRCKNSTISFILSPNPEDSKKLNDLDYLNITHTFLSELNLENRQYVCVQHNHQNLTHLHLIINRINEQGKAYSDSFLGRRILKVAHKTATKLGLKTVKQAREKKMSRLKAIIEPAHKAVLKMSPKTIDEYCLLMKEKGVETKRKYSSTNKLVGLSFIVNGESIKASAINRNYSASKLAKTISQHLKPKKKFFKKIKPKL